MLFCYVFVIALFFGGDKVDEMQIKAIESKKRYLKRYKKNLSCIARLEDQIETIQTRISTVSGSRLTGMPRGGSGLSKEDLILKKTELEERLTSVRRKSLDLRRETYKEIDRLNDVRYVEVLESIFIDCLDLDTTADMLGYGRRHVQRLYSEALRELAIIQG